MSEPVQHWQTDKAPELNQHWEQAERAWDERAEDLSAKTPLKTFKKNPNLPGIRKKTRKYLAWKTLHYLHSHDSSGVLRRYFWRHPIKHGVGLTRNLFRSLRGKPSYERDGDFFFYDLKNTEALYEALENPKTLLVVGFSYCHKPFECPAGRFTDACYHDQGNEVCGQCFIGKSIHFLPKIIEQDRIIPLFITTVHYLGEALVKLRLTRPGYEPLFVVTACELTLEMFGFIGASVGFKGIGVRLDGQICNTMRAFEASEEGIKPGMAIVTETTQTRMMDVYRGIGQTMPRSSQDNSGEGVMRSLQRSDEGDHIITTDRQV